jgi:alkylation response protein AidB-like acyl-CoA dehydrogenase
MAGAAGRVRDITVRYTGERHQFGKPIGRFPGVQQHVVSVAQQAAMLEMAADLACAAAATARLGRHHPLAPVPSAPEPLAPVPPACRLRNRPAKSVVDCAIDMSALASALA